VVVKRVVIMMMRRQAAHRDYEQTCRDQKRNSEFRCPGS